MAFFKKTKRTPSTGELHANQPAPELSAPKRLDWLHRALHDNRGLRYFFAAIGFILAVGFGLLTMFAQYKNPQIATVSQVFKKKAPEPIKYYSPLTGIEVTDDATTKRPVTAVMIENSPDARPQSGLKNSGVVYEAVAEAGITRFLVIYQEQQPALIGPVRSVRPYYVDWAAPYDASIAHVGGSYNALQEVRNGQYRDIDQFFNPKAYYRSGDRVAPHNVYTGFERLNNLNVEKGFTASNFTGFVRTPVPAAKPVSTKKTKAPVAPALAAANNIQVNISRYGLYNSSYTYDAASKTYPRSQDGAPHVDRENGQIAPTVLVVIKVPTVLGFEDGYREQMQTIGEGEGYIFQNGTVQGMKWSKAGKKNQLRFVDGKGKDIPLERGQTWVAAIASEMTVAWQ